MPGNGILRNREINFGCSAAAQLLSTELFAKPVAVAFPVDFRTWPSGELAIVFIRVRSGDAQRLDSVGSSLPQLLVSDRDPVGDEH